jgi:hypothetical protein
VGRKTTIADPAAATRADQIRRDFTADASKLNSRWCGDITYIGTWEGWLYLATVIDIASGRVVERDRCPLWVMGVEASLGLKIALLSGDLLATMGRYGH